MNIIEENIKREYVVNKSKFIVIINYSNNKGESLSILDKIKKEYTGATHYCYCYINNNNIKYSDDSEPHGSAGAMIYNVLNNFKMNNCICIVVRYFGGTKLGLGLLTRTYFNVVNECIKDSNIIEFIEKKNITIEFDYDLNEKINYIVNDYIVNKKYDESVIYSLAIPVDKYDIIISQIKYYKIKIDE